MSLQDSLFAEDVEYDVTLFSKDNRRKRVLVFPPVNNYRRYLIHRLVQDRFAEFLRTFSIGQGLQRRTVVCYKTDVIREPGSNAVQQEESPSKSSSRGMSVEEQRSPPKSPEHTRLEHQHQQKQIDSRIVSNCKSVTPAVEIYRPPPARKARNEARSQLRETSVRSKIEDNDIDVITAVHPSISSSAPSNVRNNRQRRPDRAVYVPRHRRSLETECTSRRSQEDVVVSQEIERTTLPSLSSSLICEEQELKTINSFNNTTGQDLDLNQDRSSSNSLVASASSIKTENMEESQEKVVELIDKDYQVTQMESVEGEQIQDVSLSSSQETKHIIEETCKEAIISLNEPEVQVHEMTSNNIKNVISLNEPVVSNNVNKDNESKENLSNRNNTIVKKNESNNIIRRNMVSDVLIISDVVDKEPVKKVKQVPAIPVPPTEKKTKKVERQKSKPAPPPSPPIKISRDECDWDSLFDDNGDCLDPSLIEELTTAVGEVMIEQPKNDYKVYTKQVEVSSDEFAHVIEIYNFPSDFKTSDLAAVFSPFKNGGFELKWVDDTHCLGVFSSPLVAAEVLASDHPFVKTRPLSEATTLSKTKARRSAEFLQPYRSRPETCAALARRLVTGALGVKLATARQEREHEKNVLREAKEKRRLANKQREDAWEGIIPQK